MSDETFDAVIIGGGTKGLFFAMCLTRYGGMTVGMFERRHEIGGFGTVVGAPTLPLEAVARKGVKNLTMVANTTGFGKDV